MRSKLSNVVSLIYGQIYFPTYTNGLKDIGAYLGTTWSQDANGLLSIAWRDAWSISERFEFRALIEKYNSDDCVALCIVVDFLRKVSISKEEAVVEGKQIGDGGDARLNTNYRWGNTSFLVPELEAINKCAYFDYQSSKIFFGQNRKRKQRIAGSRAKQKIRARINKTVVLEAPTRCPRCKSTETYRHGRYSRTLVDVRFTDGGIKRWIVKYIGLRRSCRRCRHVYVPPSYPRFVPLYGEGLTSLVVYLNIALRLTSGEIREYLHRVLGLSIAHSMVWRMKQTRAEYYKGTTKQLFRSMKKGHLLQVDETNVKVDRKGCYVWVFATLSEVVYLFAETRKGDILQANLKNFKGVLISDFFAAYDAVPCRQQKCLVHLIRDLNDDLFKNQLDEEFKALVVEFAILMNGIVATIDRWGLRAKYMKKHGRDVDRFYRRISRREFGSEVGLQYQKRFLKNRDRLFVFLEHDNVPWNNNYAENAIKTFAEFRRKFNKRFQPDGLREYLILLSLQHTCKLRGIDFLKFLLSGKRSLPQAGSFRE
jgi:hypothetical protein